MATFGTLINEDKPVLLAFFNDEIKGLIDNIHGASRCLASEFGEDLKVVKIDMIKNEILTEALTIKVPGFVLYKNKDLVWRSSPKTDMDQLAKIINQYVI